MSPKYEILHEFCYNTQKTPDISALMYAFPAIFYFYVGVVVAAAAAIDVAVASAARRGAALLTAAGQISFFFHPSCERTQLTALPLATRSLPLPPPLRISRGIALMDTCSPVS